MKTYKFEIKEGSPLQVSVYESTTPDRMKGFIDFADLDNAIARLKGFRPESFDMLLRLHDELGAQMRMRSTRETAPHYLDVIGVLSRVMHGVYDKDFNLRHINTRSSSK